LGEVVWRRCRDIRLSLMLATVSSLTRSCHAFSSSGCSGTGLEVEGSKLGDKRFAC
jgi:hypothetical protein